MRVKLRRILRKNRSDGIIISDFLKASGHSLTVLDYDDAVLMGSSSFEKQPRTAVKQGADVAGWVAGPQELAKPVAAMLERMLAQESEKRALADELLDSYRELNVLYNLSEHLLATPQPDSIAATTLREIEQLIRFSSAWVMLAGDEQQILQPIAVVGRSSNLRIDSGQDAFVSEVLGKTEADIDNHVDAVRILEEPHVEHVALLWAPLKTEQRLLGVIILVGLPPFSFSARDLKLLNSIALQAGPAIEMARLYQIALIQGRMERELQMAYEVQASLIPTETGDISETGWEFAGRWIPARELSGDYYDFIPRGPQRYGLVIADVADKGLSSALFMVNTRSAVRTAVDETRSPAETIFGANQRLAKEAADGLFVSMIYGELNSVTGSFSYVNAGHNPALLHRSVDNSLQELGHTGMPIGILEDTPYKQVQLKIRRGDTLVLYTDGVTEAMNAEYEEYGLIRLKSLIRKNSEASAERLAALIEESVDQFTASAPLFDDFTLMVVRRE